MTKRKGDSFPKRVHVIARDDGWAVKKEGLSRASRLTRTKGEAVDSARTLKKSGHDIVVHRKDGSIEKWEKSKR